MSRSHGNVVRIGDKRVVYQRHTGGGLIMVGDDMFVRPDDLPARVAVLRVTEEFQYEYPLTKRYPRWKEVSIELDEESLVLAPPPPPPWWRRLLAWLGGGRKGIPAARALAPGARDRLIAKAEE